jgi:hypothetical protein
MNQQLFYSAFRHERVIVFTTGIEKSRDLADVFFGFKGAARGMNNWPTGRAIPSGCA